MGCNSSNPEFNGATTQAETTENEDAAPADDEAKNESNSAARTASLKSRHAPDDPQSQSKAEIYVVDEEEAAIKIQAAYRGHRARKPVAAAEQDSGNMITDNKSDDPTKEELEAEFRPDDVELCKAATKIQASFRGHMSRKTGDKADDEDGSAPQRADEEELDIDLTDPELSKAASKIQASFRGHMARKENEGDEKHS